jgi:hypothetical protein
MAEDRNRDPSTHIDPTVEEHNLDNLARGLASGSISRRQAVRWMGGALLGSVLAIVPGVEAFAAPKPAKGRCPTGFVNCRGTCVKTQSNSSHCGGCFIQCSQNEACCGGRCSDLCSDSSNCGFCGNACTGGRVCQFCGCSCPNGTVECGGECVSDSCPEGREFDFSTCRCECSGGTVECGGECLSTTCPGGQVFNSSTCQCECPGGVPESCPEGREFDPITCRCECSGGTVECGGECLSTTCPGGQVFNPTTCQCEVPCGPPAICGSAATRCRQETGQFCICTATLEGGSVCGSALECGPPCTSSAECPQLFGPGAFCQAPNTGCCGQRCIKLCGT